MQTLVVDGFGDDPEAEFLAHLRQNLQSRLTQTLKAVRGSPRLVRAAAKQTNSSLGEALGDGQRLLLALNGAGPRPERYFCAADNDIAGRRGNTQHTVFFFGVAA